MRMTKGAVAANPDAYIQALSGWQRDRAEMLRAAILRAAPFSEVIKWTNLVFLAKGPCIALRAEDHRVIMALFRGKRLVHLDARIRPSGKFELANLILTEAITIDPAIVEQIAAAAFRLNHELGDPTARHA